MDWANLGLPCLLVRPLTNLQFKEGLRIPYWYELQRISGRPFPTKDYVYPRYKRAEALSMLLSGSVTNVSYRKKKIHVKY